MTVKPEELLPPRPPPPPQSHSPELAKVAGGEAAKGAGAGDQADADDQESLASSEDSAAESPRSSAAAMAGQRRRWWKKIGSVHSQILRIREEDSHLGEDFGEAEAKMIAHHQQQQLASQILIFSKPNLPSSPLSGRTAAVKAFH